MHTTVCNWESLSGTIPLMKGKLWQWYWSSKNSTRTCLAEVALLSKYSHVIGKCGFVFMAEVALLIPLSIS